MRTIATFLDLALVAVVALTRFGVVEAAVAINRAPGLIRGFALTPRIA
jgi:hypothetical protein